MQALVKPNTYDEIDLRDLFFALWAHKLLIAFAVAFGIIGGGYYSLTAKKEYRSVAVFKLDSDSPNGLSLSGDLEALAAIGGIGVNVANGLALEKITGRIFIQTLDKKLNFQNDQYFNTYNPYATEPFWKSRIKRAIGWQSTSLSDQEAIWQGIVSKFSNSVSVDHKSGGSVKISVIHENPLRAAEIANAMMNEIISAKRKKNKADVDEKLSYLSNSLAEALSTMVLAQSKLKEFALENSALPLESFQVGSLELDTLREQFGRTSELHAAVAELMSVLQNRTVGQDDYVSLREKFPVVDQVEFRRVLGQNEIISSWTWPETSSVAAILDTLTERKARLLSQIKAAQVDAERSGRALETFAKLERESKIAEATYQVLIEQVKAQSVIAGYRPDQSEVYEYASPAIASSSPRRSLALALGAVLGLFSGAGFSLLWSLWRDVHYSKKSLQSGAQAQFTASVRDLMPLRNKSLNEVEVMLSKKPLSTLRNLAVEVNKSSARHIIITSSRAKLKCMDTAKALACYMQLDGVKVAIINFSEKSKKIDTKEERSPVGSFLAETGGHTSILWPDGDLPAIELLSRREFLKDIQSLHSTFDLVFLCADDVDAISLLSALEGQKTFHIMVARIRHTKSKVLTSMRLLLPIQGLLHD